MRTCLVAVLITSVTPSFEGCSTSFGLPDPFTPSFMLLRRKEVRAVMREDEREGVLDSAGTMQELDECH